MITKKKTLLNLFGAKESNCRVDDGHGSSMPARHSFHGWLQRERPIRVTQKKEERQVGNSNSLEVSSSLYNRLSFVVGQTNSHNEENHHHHIVKNVFFSPLLNTMHGTVPARCIAIIYLQHNRFIWLVLLMSDQLVSSLATGKTDERARASFRIVATQCALKKTRHQLVRWPHLCTFNRKEVVTKPAKRFQQFQSVRAPTLFAYFFLVHHSRVWRENALQPSIHIYRPARVAISNEAATRYFSS